MRLNEFKSPTDFINIILDNCTNILVEYKSARNVLFRGVHESKEFFVAETNFSNRKPVNMEEDIDKAINLKLKESRFVARRNNSIFCTSDRLFAKYYGAPYVIFPFNGYNYTYCTSHDLFTDIDTTLTPEDIYKMSAQEFVNEFDWHKNNLKWALDEGVETYINGEYIAVRYGIQANTKLLSELLGFSL